MRKKTFSGVQLKAEKGAFRAIFSRFNVIDHDGDVTVPGAFKEGQAVRISYWGHRWQDLPVGRGTIHTDSQKAWVDGRFFLDTEGGRETYNVVKGLNELQEWSYGFDVLDSEPGKFEGQRVTFLRRLDVHEVSPVLKGAGIGTHTEYVKSSYPGRDALIARIEAMNPYRPGGPAAARRRIEAMERDTCSPKAYGRHIDRLLTQRLFEEIAEVGQLVKRVKENAPMTRLEAYRQELLDEGYSPPLVDAWVQAGIRGMADRLAMINPAFAQADPDWALTEALRQLETPA